MKVVLKIILIIIFFSSCQKNKIEVNFVLLPSVKKAEHNGKSSSFNSKSDFIFYSQSNELPILTVYILIKLFKRFYNYRNISNFFVLFTFIFYGGITFNYKVYALIFILLFINYNLDKSKNHEILNTQ